MGLRRRAGREHADVVIDVRERLAPYVEMLSWGDEPELALAPVAVIEPRHAATPYQPRHLAT